MTTDGTNYQITISVVERLRKRGGNVFNRGDSAGVDKHGIDSRMVNYRRLVRLQGRGEWGKSDIHGVGGSTKGVAKKRA